MMSLSEACDVGALDAHAQAELLKSGRMSPAELVESAILRIEHLNPSLNIITWKAYEQARESARNAAPLRDLTGVPCLLKETLDYPGMPNRSASRSRSAAINHSLEFDYSRRLDAAGLIPVGKTNAPEFSLLASTEPLLYGASRNPWALDHSVGGSSGGAAAAVASGMVPLAHGGDGGGSIRIPASCCGVLGFKPGRGGNVRARAHHLVEDLLVSDVLLCRTVRDTDWAVAMAAPTVDAQLVRTAASKRLRIAVMQRDLFDRAPHPEVVSSVRKTADLCARLGHQVEAAPTFAEGPAVMAAFRTLWGYVGLEIVGSCRSSPEGLENILEPWTLGLADWGRTLSPADLEQAYETAFRSAQALQRLFEDWDVILSPVLPQPPSKLGELAPQRPFEELFESLFNYISYTPLHNLAGVPAMSVPLFTSTDGLPLGSMFAAARGQEALLLGLAYELEAAQPWSQRWPLTSIKPPHGHQR
jgi:amidase